MLPGGAKGAKSFADVRPLPGRLCWSSGHAGQLTPARHALFWLSCQSEHVRTILKKQHGAGKDVAAICAAPIALHAAGIAPGGKLTSHPSVKDQLEQGKGPNPKAHAGT